MPLIALQYQAVELEVTLAPLFELYTALEVDSGNTGFGKRVIPSTTNESRLGIDKFVIDQTFINSRNINLQVENTYVFLDDAERKRFSVYEHEYLITQPFLTEKQGSPMLQGVEETQLRIIPALNKGQVSQLKLEQKREPHRQVTSLATIHNW